MSEDTKFIMEMLMIKVMVIAVVAVVYWST